MAKVTVIEPTITNNRDYGDDYDGSNPIPGNSPRLKVAAYARVSTDLEEQQSSYNAQIEYYTKKIKANPNWEFAGIYADEGISGTSIKKRVSFQQMILRALNGEIDLILTKSISRFGRNTIDVLETVRKLKECDVEVFFEKENIRSLDPNCEILLTVLSTFAQEESRSLSKNIRWAHEKRMQEGKVSISYSHFLGYEKGEDGRPKIVKEEAKIVQLIYQLFLDNYTIAHIGRILEGKGYKTPAGKDKWHPASIRAILTNEKYAGRAILQKTYTQDFMDKVRKPNNGQRKKYIVENSHDAIIDPATYDKVQEIMNQRKHTGSRRRDDHPFANYIFCGDCGAKYHRKGWSKLKTKTELKKELEAHPDQIPSKYTRRDVWICHDRYKRKDGNNKGEDNNTQKTNKQRLDMKNVTANRKPGRPKQFIRQNATCTSPVLEDKDIIRAFNEMLIQAKLSDKKYSEELWRNLVGKVIANPDNTLTFILKNDCAYTVPVKTKNVKAEDIE